MYQGIILLLGLGLAGCASYVADYEERLIRSLPNQREVTLSDTKSYPGRILCGRYTALTGQGFTTRSSRFVVGDDFVLNNPTADDIAVYCSKNPGTALMTQLAIGTADGDWSPWVRVRDDMRAIDRGINRYYDERHTLPRDLRRLLDGDYGVTAMTLTDPWGTAYRYSGGLAGRTAPQHTLLCLGADGMPGGEALAADVSRGQLHLLDHVLRLQGY